MYGFSRPSSQRTRFTLCILFPLHCKTNGARWGRIFFVRYQLREFAQRFGVGLPPSSCTRKGKNPHFWCLLSGTIIWSFFDFTAICCSSCFSMLSVWTKYSKFRMSVVVVFVVVVAVATVCMLYVCTEICKYVFRNCKNNRQIWEVFNLLNRSGHCKYIPRGLTFRNCTC